MENVVGTYLEDTLAKDISDHDSSNELTLLTIWLTEQEVVSRLLSTQCKGGHGIHDQVHPQQLYGSQRSTESGHSTKECYNKGDNVDSKLELKELSDVIVNTSSPQNTTNC